MKSILFAIVVFVSACAPAPSRAQISPVMMSFDVSSGRPVVEARINGQGPFPIIIDTGAATNLLVASVSRELRLTSIGQAPLTSPYANGPPVQGDFVALDSISISGLERRNEHAVAIPDNVLPLRGARGVFSPRMFSDRVVEVDVSAEALWVGPAPRRAVRNWLPIGHGGLLETQVVIGGVSIPARIDTGNPGVITLPTSFAARLPLREPLRDSGGMGTIDAALVTSLGRLDADATIAGAPARIDVATFAALPEANVGMAGLGGFIVVIDYSNNRWALLGASAAPLEAKALLGALGAHEMPERDGALRVRALDQNSRARTAGLQVGDRIVLVNGSQVALMNPNVLRGSLAAPNVRIGVERQGARLELVVP